MTIRNKSYCSKMIVLLKPISYRMINFSSNVYTNFSSNFDSNFSSNVTLRRISRPTLRRISHPKLTLISHRTSTRISHPALTRISHPTLTIFLIWHEFLIQRWREWWEIRHVFRLLVHRVRVRLLLGRKHPGQGPGGQLHVCGVEVRLLPGRRHRGEGTQLRRVLRRSRSARRWATLIVIDKGAQPPLTVNYYESLQFSEARALFKH